VENEVKNSRLDHVYHNEHTSIRDISIEPLAYSDHHLVTFVTDVSIENQTIKREQWMRNWYGYTKQKLIDMLSHKQWYSDIEKAQDYFNWMENELIKIIDKIAPLTLRKSVNTSSYHENSSKSLVNKHRRLVAKWKERKNQKYWDEANKLKKKIRLEVHNNRKTKVRKHIKTGNSKTL
jgi:hypothetical protein